jgi:endonuclease/exonuclease/phosphatase family metal-dependent hydrolase
MFGKTILKGILLTINLVVVVLMLITMGGTFISPDIIVLPAYTTLFFPLTVLLNVVFVVFWAFARKWHFLISLVVLLLAAPQIADVFPMHFGKTSPAATEGTPVTILTYNTQMSGGLLKHTAENPNPVIEYILNSNADIVCLQEFAVSPKEQYLTEKDIRQIFRKYPYSHIWLKQKQDWAMSGVATFSNFPIIHKYDIPFSSKYMVSISSDIVVGNDTIRLINNHLESNKLTERDREMPIELKDHFNSDKLSGTTLHLSRKLGSAYRTRARQADTIAAYSSGSPYPLVIVGDFNDVPASYTYTKIKGKLKDAFSETGFGLGWTLNLSIYKFRIDYVLYDPKFTVDKYKVPQIKFSDHFPVLCKLYIKK